MKIAIVGTGYVGLVTGTCLADVGFDVTCIDINQEKIEMLNSGKSPIYEPGIEGMIQRNLLNGRLHFSTSLLSVIDDVEVVFSAVGTPPDEDGSADLQYVLDVAEQLGNSMNSYKLLVTKSTVPVGTAEKVRKTIGDALKRRGAEIDFDVASNPEFLKEGDAISDFMHPDRIVVGVDSDKAKALLEKIYKPFVLSGHSLIITDIASAEMIKYAANSMLATRISFMNDIANLCERVGADINMVRLGIGSDTRIGNKFLNAGIGYGGSCFPKDVKALIKVAEQNNCPLSVLKAVEDVNERQKEVLFNKLHSFYNGNLSDKTIALLGLSFKPNTDDMREAPSLILIKKLQETGCKIRVYDPVAMKECQRRIGNTVTYCKDKYDAISGADAVLLVTEWAEFKVMDWEKLKNVMHIPVIFDGRNLYNSHEMKNLGIEYFCIGKK